MARRKSRLEAGFAEVRSGMQRHVWHVLMFVSMSMLQRPAEGVHCLGCTLDCISPYMMHRLTLQGVTGSYFSSAETAAAGLLLHDYGCRVTISYRSWRISLQFSAPTPWGLRGLSLSMRVPGSWAGVQAGEGDSGCRYCQIKPSHSQRGGCHWGGARAGGQGWLRGAARPAWRQLSGCSQALPRDGCVLAPGQVPGESPLSSSCDFMYCFVDCLVVFVILCSPTWVRLLYYYWRLLLQWCCKALGPVPLKSLCSYLQKGGSTLCLCRQGTCMHVCMLLFVGISITVWVAARRTWLMFHRLSLVPDNAGSPGDRCFPAVGACVPRTCEESGVTVRPLYPLLHCRDVALRLHAAACAYNMGPYNTASLPFKYLACCVWHNCACEVWVVGAPSDGHHLAAMPFMKCSLKVIPCCSCDAFKEWEAVFLSRAKAPWSIIEGCNCTTAG